MPHSIMRFSAIVAFITSVSSVALNPLPARTIAGHHIHPQIPKPTEGPSFELLRRKINAGLAKEKRDVTSVCSEWTISGGYGQPECYDGETCLFTSAGATLLEGCGSQGVRYNWYTECSDYTSGQSSAPISQLFCDAQEPFCGSFAFQLATGVTYYNYGCSSSAYGLNVGLLPSASSNTSLTLAGSFPSSTTTVITTGATDFATQTIPPVPAGTHKNSSGGKKKKKTPVGGIVGAVVGGIIVLGFLIFLAIWFLRKRKTQKKAVELQANEAQAFHNLQNQEPKGVSEMDGTTESDPMMRGHGHEARGYYEKDGHGTPHTQYTELETPNTGTYQTQYAELDTPGTGTLNSLQQGQEGGPSIGVKEGDSEKIHRMERPRPT